jgi:hypothetical protein
MYCEINVKHRKTIDAAGLERAIRVTFGNDIPVLIAYARSAIYRAVVPPLAAAGAPIPASLFAFDTALNCFVIVRRVTVQLSTYHVEGNTTLVPVETLLQAAQEFASQLSRILQDCAESSVYGARAVTIQLFEDNGKETGMQGEVVTWNSAFGNEFSWKELKSSVIPFVTALLLIWQGLKQEPIRASIYSFAIAMAFALTQAIAGYWRGRGKIKWKLRQS